MIKWELSALQKLPFSKCVYAHFLTINKGFCGAEIISIVMISLINYTQKLFGYLFTLYEISRWKAHTNTWKLNWNVSMITDVFLDQKRVNVCEHMVKPAPQSRKTSMIVETFQLNFCVPFIRRSLNFFLVRVFSFFFYFCIFFMLNFHSLICKSMRVVVIAL